MEEVKKVVEPKKEKKVAPKKPVKKTTTIIQVNLARGFFMTGLLGMIFFGLIVFEVLNPTSGIPEQLLENSVNLLQTSAGLFLIGAFSFTKK
jgi:hypothetical protein